MVSQAIQTADSISKVFTLRAVESADQVAYEYESDGQWLPVLWREYAEFVKYASLGLRSLGFESDQRAAIWGETMPEWTVLDLATMAAGGCTAGIYQTSTPDQAAYIINDSSASWIAVDSVERLEKAFSIREQTPSVRFYITWGGGEDEARDIYSYAGLIERGKAFAQSNPTAYEDAVDTVTADTIAVLVYTSGTTGPPKGAMLSHRNCLFCCKSAHDRLDLNGESTNVAFLPLSHVAEHVVGFFNRIYSGGVAYFLSDMNRFGEVAQAKCPTLIGGVPRLFEKAHSAIMDRAAGASPPKRALFDWALSTGASVSQLTRAQAPIPRTTAAAHRIADKMVLSKVRMALGGQVGHIVCGAAPISTHIVEFFDAIGIPFLEVYGMTETSGLTHMNYPERNKPGTVGTAVAGVECRIEADGEILVRGDAVFQGYLNKPQETADTIDADGWLHTGDIGEIDDEGFLTITDRKKNLIITAGGKNIAPSNIEMLIARHPIISQVLVLGDRRKYLSALITVSQEDIQQVAAQKEFEGLTPEELVKTEPIIRKVQEAIDLANKELARYENIRTFKILHREFSIESEEMTPTMKLKRRVIEDNYAEEIEALYVDRVEETV